MILFIVVRIHVPLFLYLLATFCISYLLCLPQVALQAFINTIE